MNTMIPIPGHPGYYATDSGYIFSEKGVNLRRLKGRPRRYGHLWVYLAKAGGTGRDYAVHRLVLMTFVGEPPKGMECMHLNGNASDNRLSNLKWGTAKENGQDKILHGTVYKAQGEKSATAKLTVEQVKEIKTSDEYGSVLARKFSVCGHTIYNIRKDKTWRFV